ncbi:MAG: ubiquitin-like protein Pup [Bowdeniella nasicola]|nr:ubiquitin-like protein Pup [Bowdeniella nasicola]
MRREHVQPRTKTSSLEEEEVEVATGAQTSSVDDLLDEIDEVLEENAESFVAGFVQKGGQ